jgi:hypothetical protein
MKVLTQTVGRSWRSFKIADKDLLVETHSRDIQAQKTIPLLALGLPKNDFEYSKQVEILRKNYTVSILLTVPMLVFSIITTVASNNSAKFPANGTELLLLLISLVLLIAFLAYHIGTIKSVRMKTINFTGGYTLTFYCRNQIDQDQIDSFLNDITLVQHQTYKQHFIHELSANPVGLKQHLQDLHNASIVDDAEYMEFLSKINEAENGAKTDSD